MIGYVTLGSNDLDKACQFYDELLAELGAQRLMEVNKLQFWGKSSKGPFLAVGSPYDGEAACVGNGSMVSLAASSRDKVDAVHHKALALGAEDEGQPGFRTGDFYGAYFRDPDGNKLCVFTIVQSQ